jgi:DNA repair protein RadA/Sms
MEKNLGLELTGDDIFVNVAGGVKIDEPAVDLGILSAILSSFWDTPVRSGTVVSGEVGLTGEVRAVSRAEQRVGEAEKLGFKRCVLPRGNATHMQRPGTMELIGVDSVSEAVESLF